MKITRDLLKSNGEKLLSVAFENKTPEQVKWDDIKDAYAIYSVNEETGESVLVDSLQWGEIQIIQDAPQGLWAKFKALFGF